MQKKLAETKAAEQEDAKQNAIVERVSSAIKFVDDSRHLGEEVTKMRLPSVLMTAKERYGPEAALNGELLLKVHDDIFGVVAQEPLPVTRTAPNPPGVKRPSAVEPAPKNTGPQLKQDERGILRNLAEEIQERGIKLDPERLAARYAANLKRARG